MLRRSLGWLSACALLLSVTLTAQQNATLQGVVADGVADVRGYYHWSLTDNFEWASGYFPKFGAFAFDPATGKRTLRDGARVLRDVAKANGITPKLLKKYD